MMSSNFDPWESNNTGAKPGDDDPLAVFESAGGGGGGGSTGGTNNISENYGGTADLLGTGFDADANTNNNVRATGATTEEYGFGSNDKDITENGGTVDLLGTGMGADVHNVRATEDDDLFGEVNGKMEEFNLGSNDQNQKEIEIEEEGDDDGDDDESAEGDNIMDMQGWNLRNHRSDPEGEDDDANVAAEYGIDNKTPAMQANASGERNNSRRGLFGRWGSRRSSNNSSSYSDNPGKPMEGISSTDPRPGESTLGYDEGGIAGNVDDRNAAIDEEKELEEKMDNRLRPGDHVYVWQTYGINPRAYQRHAVVFSVTRRGEADPITLPASTGPDEGSPPGEEQLSFDMDHLYDSDDEYDEGVEVTVVSFYHLGAASGGRGGRRRGAKREHLLDFIGPDGINRKKPVRKVRYGRKVKKGLLSQKAGVGTALKKDAVGLILARVQYTLDNPDKLPAHNALSANGECASLWCVTGRWCTLQGASILAITSVGQAGGALLAGGILSNLTILVPMPGVWGMAGWWWYVPATVAYPFLVPMLVTLGMASLVPLEILRRNRKKWRGITDGLNHEFWSNADEDTREEYFGQMATAEREAEMRSFFGVREGEATADDAKYMPVGEAPGGVDDEDEEEEALAMQRMEQSCQGMAADMKVDLSGKPPEESSKA
eukprot:CAMPEP_0172534254 /NCGR_PEP_ID=MMETSP1067-20121228/6685_1 /TAXON_ID=265564 ORGANISM="Thalassiosira punctigera, Strain Tpunct2005C2" /NCGR_SAMPLE_ID=MMETSP1067 /ASSEMBLY_ACC=CAM_ASM_000444 /LENGTH=659 /DNA_ID=CAMNT_0013319027 /DNA_START=26 /DNA_END=2002 /DNA_ORIENTATION=+